MAIPHNKQAVNRPGAVQRNLYADAAHQVYARLERHLDEIGADPSGEARISPEPGSRERWSATVDRQEAVPHVIPGMQAEAAALVAALVFGLKSTTT